MNDELCQLMGVKCNITSAYHPQSNGLDERFNQTLQRQLLKYTSEEQNKWDLYLDAILFSYRVSRQDSTRVSPFMLVYGRQPRLPVEFSLNAAESRDDDGQEGEHSSAELNEENSIDLERGGSSKEKNEEENFEQKEDRVNPAKANEEENSSFEEEMNFTEKNVEDESIQDGESCAGKDEEDEGGQKRERSFPEQNEEDSGDLEQERSSAEKINDRSYNQEEERGEHAKMKKDSSGLLQTEMTSTKNMKDDGVQNESC